MKNYIFGKSLVAAHRGHSGGNIPCNTLVSYERALMDGAEVIELDVTKSSDGVLFCFHPGMEPVFYASPTLITGMPAEEVKRRPLLNTDHNETLFTAPLLDEALELLKGRCLIAVDKFWMNMPEIAEVIRHHHMEEDVMCKIQNRESCFQEASCVALDMPLLPVVRHRDVITEKLLKSGLKIAGMEVIFDNDKDAVASDEYIRFMHKNGLFLWVNSIIYDYREQLAGGHSDDIAIAGEPDRGWGWLIDKEFDIIQTDWIPEFLSYRKSVIGR